jgi:hypothetical protein
MNATRAPGGMQDLSGVMMRILSLKNGTTLPNPETGFQYTESHPPSLGDTPNNTCVFVGGLPIGVNELDLKILFEIFGKTQLVSRSFLSAYTQLDMVS